MDAQDEFSDEWNKDEPKAEPKGPSKAQAAAEAERARQEDEYAQGWGLVPDGAAPAQSKPEPSFAEALASAKAAGQKSFAWNGKDYSAGLSNESKPEAPAKKVVAKPAAKTASAPVAPAEPAAPAAKPASEPASAPKVVASGDGKPSSLVINKDTQFTGMGASSAPHVQRGGRS